MGADSAGIDPSYNLSVRRDPKVFLRGPFLIGFCGSFRMGQILRFNLSIPMRIEGQTDDEYMATSFIEEVRSCLKNGGLARVENNEESGGFFLVGFGNRLWQVQSDFQIGEVMDPYDAVGCGAHYAIGALSVLSDGTAEDKILKSLEVAEKYSGGVRRPFYVLNNACPA